MTSQPPRRFPTSSHTIGPFFPPEYFRDADNDLTLQSDDATGSIRGTPFILHGTVSKEGGVPVPNMILEMWQADADGHFRHPADPNADLADPDFLGWGRSWTTLEGEYSFRSLIPGSYHENGCARAPHVNLLIMGAGLMRPLWTTLYFPQFPGQNANDAVLTLLPADQRDRLLMQAEGKTDGIQTYRFDILMRGDANEETIFFAI